VAEIGLPNYVPLFTGIEQHIIEGGVTPADFGIYCMLHLKCDYGTGVARANADTLASAFALSSGSGPRKPEDVKRDIRRSLERLRKVRLINFSGNKSKTPYAIRLHKYIPRSGPHKYRMLDAFATPADSDKLVFRGRDSEDVSSDESEVRNNAVTTPSQRRDSAVTKPSLARDNAVTTPSQRRESGRNICSKNKEVKKVQEDKSQTRSASRGRHDANASDQAFGQRPDPETSEPPGHEFSEIAQDEYPTHEGRVNMTLSEIGVYLAQRIYDWTDAPYDEARLRAAGKLIEPVYAEVSNSMEFQLVLDFAVASEEHWMEQKVNPLPDGWWRDTLSQATDPVRMFLSSYEKIKVQFNDWKNLAEKNFREEESRRTRPLGFREPEFYRNQPPDSVARARMAAREGGVA
jgi:hypothetical protein